MQQTQGPQDILTALDPEPSRAELIDRTRQMLSRLASDELRDSVVLLAPETLEATVLGEVPGHPELCELVGGHATITSARLLTHHTMALDDAVLLKPGATLNFMATMLYNTGHPICGTVVLLPKSATE